MDDEILADEVAADRSYTEARIELGLTNPYAQQGGGQ